MILFQPYVTGAKQYLSLGIHVPFGPTYYSELREKDYDWRGKARTLQPVAQGWMHGSCIQSMSGQCLGYNQE